ncbi:hypothetical protein GCM10028784_28910 [Myceligenerans cantabricum]
MRAKRVLTLLLAGALGAATGVTVAIGPAEGEGHARAWSPAAVPSRAAAAGTLDGARAELAALAGVRSVEVLGDRTSAEFRVRLTDPAPHPDTALATYRSARATLRAGTPAAALLLVVTAGAATGPGFSVTDDPLSYADDPPGPDAVGDAAALLATPGVRRVSITATHTDVDVVSPRHLTDVAAVARGLKRGVSRLTVSGSGTGFTGPDALTVPDDALLALVAEAADLPGVSSAHLDAGAEPATAVLGALLGETGANTIGVPEITTDETRSGGGPVLTVEATDDDAVAWLEHTDHAELAGHPVAYRITSGGSDRTGWVSGRDPASFPVPTAAEAGECTGRDLRVGLNDLGDRNGRGYAELLATNIAWTPCAMTATPGLETRTADRSTPPIQVETDPSTSRNASVLRPGEQVTLPVSWPTGRAGVPLTQIVVTFTDVRPMHLDLPPGAHAPGPVRVGSWRSPES